MPAFLSSFWFLSVASFLFYRFFEGQNVLRHFPNDLFTTISLQMLLSSKQF